MVEGRRHDEARARDRSRHARRHRLLGGPIGIAVGTGTGTLIGAIWDVTRAEIGNDFIAEVSEFLLPGKAAVIGEMGEDWCVFRSIVNARFGPS